MAEPEAGHVWLLVVGLCVLGAGFVAALACTTVYRHIVCLKYLFCGWKAVVPIVSAMPAALGVFLLILVFAIMDGFVLETREMTRGTLADIIVDARLTGLPYYETFTDRIEDIEGVELATPVIETYGLVRIKPRFESFEPVVHACKLMGVRPAEKARMGRFLEYVDRHGLPEVPPEQLLATPPALAARREAEGLPDRPGAIGGIGLVGAPARDYVAEEMPKALGDRLLLGLVLVLQAAITLVVWRKVRRRPDRAAMRIALWTWVAGLAFVSALVGLKEARCWGQVEAVQRATVVDVPLLGLGQDFTVATVPVKPSGAMDLEAGGLPKARYKGVTLLGTFKSGYWESDSTHLYLDFDVAQDLAGMGGLAARGDDPGRPARCNQIQVRLAPGVDPDTVVRAIRSEWYRLVARTEMTDIPSLDVGTWETRQRMILGVVEMERNITALMLGAMFLGFGVLTALISYVMAYIKSRDVGIMKALGASDAGVGSLFLGYGFVIGLIGTAAGLAAALAMLHWLDPIEVYVNQWLDRPIFPRDVYYFDRIPRHLTADWAVGVSLAVLALSTVASAAGGFLAAVRQPVETLRYE